MHKLEKDLLADLDTVLAQEEIFWDKKSESDWLIQGDRNTRYFHTKTIIRRRKNRVILLLITYLTFSMKM